MRVVKYWLKLTEAKPEQAIYSCYQAQLRMVENGAQCWAKKVKELLLRYGFENEWNNQTVANRNSFLIEFKKRVIQSEIFQWTGDVKIFGALRLYRTLKSGLSYENFLDVGLSKNEVNLLIRLRGGLLRIGYNIGRWFGTPRVCPLCNSGEDETEEHFLYRCTAFNHFRTLTGLRRLP